MGSLRKQASKQTKKPSIPFSAQLDSPRRAAIGKIPVLVAEEDSLGKMRLRCDLNSE